jgi:hypothetical protein
MDKSKYHQMMLETMETLLEIQLKSVRTLLERTESPKALIRRTKRKRISLIDLSVELLTEEQRPIHVDEMVELLRQRHGRLTDRDSLASALAKKDKQGVLVRRVAPAMFVLRKNGSETAAAHCSKNRDQTT